MGKGRLKSGHEKLFPCIKKPFNNRPYNIKVYIPSRTCMILILKKILKNMRYPNSILSMMTIKFTIDI